MQGSEEVRNIETRPTIPDDFVRHIDSLEWHSRGNAGWACAFSSADGTRMLSLYAADLESGVSQSVGAGESEVVGYVLAGQGIATISGRDFVIQTGDGFHIRHHESLTLGQSGPGSLRVLLAVCPSPERPRWETPAGGGQAGRQAFDDDYPERVVSRSSASREATGDRYFQILIGPNMGSTAVTQFIGSIPKSRAPEHFHHYEEVICVLSGEGRMWMGDACAPVRPGSLIFLPRKQPHCLECMVEEGLELVGMFYPAGSPAVNYPA